MCRGGGGQGTSHKKAFGGSFCHVSWDIKGKPESWRDPWGHLSGTKMTVNMFPSKLSTQHPEGPDPFQLNTAITSKSTRTQLRNILPKYSPVLFRVMKDKKRKGVPVVAQRVKSWYSVCEVSGSIPGLAQRLRIQRCYELWCRLQTQLRSGVAVALVQAGSCSSALTPNLGTSICCTCSCKNKKAEELFMI